MEKSKNAGTKKLNFATCKEQQYSASDGEDDINTDQQKEEKEEKERNGEYDDLPITNNPHLPIFKLNTRNSREPNRYLKQYVDINSKHAIIYIETHITLE